MAVKSLIEAVHDALFEEMQANPWMIILGEDVGVRGGVFRATQGLLEAFGPERVIDTPLAEAAIVGVAIGASLNGLHPVAEIQFADFIHPAFDQIVSEAARMRYRSLGVWSCPLVIRAPFGGGVHGGLYHSQSIESLYAHVPGLKVVIPSTPYDAKGLLKAALRDADPVLFFEHKRAYRMIKGEVPDHDYTVPIGKAEVKRKGSSLSILSYGLMLHYCLEAAEQVAADGIDAEVVDLRTIAPLDKDTILASVRKTGKVLIVHEDNKTGGIGGELAALIVEEAFEHLDAPITRLCGPDVPAIPYAPPLEEAFLPNPARIAGALRKLAHY